MKKTTNLFAKDTSKTKAKAKDRVTVEIDCEDQMKQMSALDVKIAALQATRKVLDSEVREASQDAMMAYYNKKKSFPGTIRGDFSHVTKEFANSKNDAIRNLIHASSDEGDAKREISLWFKPEEIHKYSTVHDRHCQ